MGKIKPCPFCGCKELMPIEIDIEDREGVPMAIRCENCGIVGPWDYIPRDILSKLTPYKENVEAIAQLTGWNKRAS